MADTARHSGAGDAHFGRPMRQVLLMLIVLALVGVGVWMIYPSFITIFAANPFLNWTIVAVFAIGVVACFAQVLQVFRSVRWIEGFIEKRDGHDIRRPPGLLASLATLLREHTRRSAISTASARSIQDSVDQRLDEGREITRYIVNTLIFLGLLGTFYGLATTVPAVVDTIKNLNPSSDEETIAVFSRLMGGMEDQLAGMGTAFASSLLGLAGSLVVGLLEIFAGHGQNRFYRELEDWLSSITRVGITGDGETIDQYSLAAVLDHMNYQMEQLQEMFQRAEEGRVLADARMQSLADAVSVMADRDGGLAAVTDGLDRVAEGQHVLIQHLTAHRAEADSDMHAQMRSIDAHLLKLTEDLAQARQGTIDDLRGDMGSLTRALRALTRAATQSVDGE